MKNNDSERILFCIEKIKSGKEIFFEEILKILDIPIKGMANTYYIPGGDKEDIMQIAKIGIYEGVRTFTKDKTNNPKLFLKICAERNIKDALRQLSRDKYKTLDNAYSLNLPLNNNSKGENIVLGDIIEDKFSLDEFIETKELKSYIHENIYEKMTELESNVLRLYIRDYSNKEISLMLSLTSKQVDNALQKAKKKIKTNTKIKEYCLNY